MSPSSVLYFVTKHSHSQNKRRGKNKDVDSSSESIILTTVGLVLLYIFLRVWATRLSVLPVLELPRFLFWIFLQAVGDLLLAVLPSVFGLPRFLFWVVFRRPRQLRSYPRSAYLGCSPVCFGLAGLLRYFRLSWFSFHGFRRLGFRVSSARNALGRIVVYRCGSPSREGPHERSLFYVLSVSTAPSLSFCPGGLLLE